MSAAECSTRAGKRKGRKCQGFKIKVVCGRCQPSDRGYVPERTTSQHLILPQEGLLKLLCTECHNFLSVGPVFTGGYCPKGCCDTELVPSLFNLVVEVFVFPCINSSTGCKELLPFGQAEEHEKVCQFEECLKCPFCKYDGNRLLCHLSSEHENLIVKNGEFTFFMVGKRRYLIVIQERHILCVAIQVIKNATVIFNLLVTEKEKNLKSFSVDVFDDGCWTELIAQCELYTDPDYFPLNNNKFYKTFPEEDYRSLSYKNYVVMQNSLLQRFFSSSCDSLLCKVELKNSLAKSNFRIGGDVTNNTLYNSEILSKMDSDSLKSLLLKHKDEFQSCNNCKVFVQSELYFCPSYHLACRNCISAKCVRCNSFSLWSNKTKLHQITLSCGLKNCNEHPYIFDYFRHTQDCTFRQYLCSDHECSFVGLYDEFIKHWHSGNLCKESSIDLYIAKQQFWFLPTKDLVIINSEKFNNMGKIYIMEYNGNLTQSHQFSYFFTLVNTWGDVAWQPFANVKEKTYSGLSFSFPVTLNGGYPIRVRIATTRV